MNIGGGEGTVKVERINNLTVLGENTVKSWTEGHHSK